MKRQLIQEAKRLQELAGIKPINENFVGLTPINNPLHEDENEDDDDMFDDGDDKDTWNKPDEFDLDSDEKEPTTKDITLEPKGSLGSKESQLAQLTAKKDEILQKLKSGQISIMQYKQEIGNIPTQIKALQAAIDREMSIGDEEDLF